MADVVCPWCFEKYRDIAIQFRCINPSCTPTEDKEYSEYHNIATPIYLQQRIDPDEGFWGNMMGLEFDAVACTECKTETTKKICPKCHNELPATIGKFKHYNFAIVGSKESGKSHYIAVLLNSLQKEIGEKLDSSLLPVNDDTINRYNKEFYDPIYNDRVVLNATRSVRKHSGSKAPLIFCLQIRKPTPLGDKFEVVSLVFFDSAGEDLDHVDLMTLESKYIAQADGIIYLMDPLQAPAVRDKISGIPLPSENTNPTQVVNNILRVIRGVHRLKMNRKVTIPLAFAVSKFDAVGSMLPVGSVLSSPSRHGREFDKDDFNRVSNEVRSHLRDWLGDSGAMVREVEHNFKNFGFFAVSALGSTPDASGTLKLGVNPYRIADPLLWLLWKLKVITTVRK
ncbi:hypothetical protein K8I28_00670 [bacterium]|nr:hypothetical protein [bacterium]